MAAGRDEFSFSGLANAIDRTRVGKEWAYQGLNFDTDEGVLKGRKGYTQIGARSGAHASDVAYGLGYGKSSGNEIQRLSPGGTWTGGTFTLEFDGAQGSSLNQVSGNIDWDATADDVYTALEALAGITPSDVKVTGGPFPALPIDVEFTGQWANTNMAILVAAVGSLTGSTPSLAITERKKGGDQEAYYAVVKHNGDTDSNLYVVTSTDGFATSSWSSVASDFDSSDWFFEQYQDKILMVNRVDGLKWLFIGSTAVQGTKPEGPTQGLTITEQGYSGGSSDVRFPLGSASSYASSGFGSAPTLAAYGTYAISVATTGSENGKAVSVTATMSATYQEEFRDPGYLSIVLPAGVTIDRGSMLVQYINDDGTPVTITPPLVLPGTGLEDVVNGYTLTAAVHFLDEKRRDRDNALKVKISWTFTTCPTGKTILLYYSRGATFLCDDRGLQPDGFGTGWIPTRDEIEYAYSYYDVSESTESDLSPVTRSPRTPTNGAFGNYLWLQGYPSATLTTSDYVFFYRKEKATGRWRRLPNKASWVNLSDFGDANPTAPTRPEVFDHWMEHELANFPEPSSIGFPPNTTGIRAECIGYWKQCVVIGAAREAYISWVGNPFRFEPSPDDPLYTPPDPDIYPNVGVTEYVADNRGEDVYAVVGQDSLYAVTPLSSYSKNGDSPIESSVFRRLPGSRGCLGKRAVYRYGNGIHVGSQDGLWFYKVGRSFAKQDIGTLEEREETGPSDDGRGPGIRKSWDRLLSDLWKLELTATGGTCTLTFASQTTSAIAYNASAATVQSALEALSSLNVGDVEVFGADLPSNTLYIRFVGQYAQTDASALTITATGLTGGTGSVTELSPGFDSSTDLGRNRLIVFEHNDELWCVHNNNYIRNSRNRKWSEGFFADRWKAVVANRERGIVFIATNGTLKKMGAGYLTDGGTNIPWLYETGTMIGARTGIQKHECHVVGSPKVTIRVEDGAASSKQRTITMDSGRVQTHNASMLPGTRHRFLFNGTAGTDEVDRFTILSETASVKHGN